MTRQKRSTRYLGAARVGKAGQLSPSRRPLRIVRDMSGYREEQGKSPKKQIFVIIRYKLVPLFLVLFQTPMQISFT